MIEIAYDKIKVFETELGYIQNSEIRSFTKKIISNIPDYFFEVAASSTGKYHPKYALGKGGLVRHTKAAVGIAKDLLNLEHNRQTFSDDERDCIIAALICHDGWKHGDNGGSYTVSEHPVVASDHILTLPDKCTLNIQQEKEKTYAEMIANNIRSHMGEWNTDYKSKKEIMPKPSSETEKFVHMCDYLASRKYLIYDDECPYDPDKYVLEDNSLKEHMSKLVQLCKEKISGGVDRDEIYKIISEKNNGNKNPNSISDVKIVEELIQTIGGMGV